MSDLVFNLVVLVLDLSTALFIIWSLVTGNGSLKIPDEYKIGLWIGAIGLIGQSIRNILFVAYGYSPPDNEVPLWVLKDVGYWAICITAIVYRIRGK